MMNKKEQLILLNFLKSGLSTRELDKLLNNHNSHGWISWKVLKQYNLINGDKGSLFLYTTSQSNQLIKELVSNSENKLNTLIKKYPPTTIQKYAQTKVIANSEKDFYNIMSGETRNIIQGFFNPKKELLVNANLLIVVHRAHMILCICQKIGLKYLLRVQKKIKYC